MSSNTKNLTTHIFSIEIERFYLRLSLNAILESILFQRTFNKMNPVQQTIKELSTTFISLPANTGFISENLTKIIDYIDSQKQQKFQISVKFYGKNSNIVWEEFQLNIVLKRAKNEKEQLQLHKKLAIDLENLLRELCLDCLENSENIPPLLDLKPFPVDVRLL